MAYQVYFGKGYIKENENKWLVQPYDFNDETVILIVQDKNKKLAGSVTLVFDGDSKIPAEKTFSDELKVLKNSGNKMVELSRLVIAPEFRNSKEILVLLFNYLAIYAHHVKNYNCLIVEVNPRHKTYYKALLNFNELGGEKRCPQVQNAPGVLLYLPTSIYQSEVKRCGGLRNSDIKERSLYPYFIKTEKEGLVASYLEKQATPISIEEKLYFGYSQSGKYKAICV